MRGTKQGSRSTKRPVYQVQACCERRWEMEGSPLRTEAQVFLCSSLVHYRRAKPSAARRSPRHHAAVLQCPPRLLEAQSVTAPAVIGCGNPDTSVAPLTCGGWVQKKQACRNKVCVAKRKSTRIVRIGRYVHLRLGKRMACKLSAASELRTC